MADRHDEGMVDVADLKARLSAAIRTVAAACDGAHELDGVGFDGADTVPGRRIAACPPETWSDAIAGQVAVWVRKYQGQIGPHAPALAAEALDVFGERRAVSADIRVVHVCEDGFTIRFGYNPDLTAAMRGVIPEVVWRRDHQVWVAPARHGQAVEQFATLHQFALSNAAKTLVKVAGNMPAPAPGHVDFDGQDLTIRFPARPQPAVITAIKALPSRRYDPAAALWRVPVRYTRPVRELAGLYGWDTSATVDDLPDIDPTVTDVTVTVDGEMLNVAFPYDQGLIAVMRRLGARWDMTGRTWRIPIEQGFELLSELDQANVALTDVAGDVLARARTMLANVARSRALDDDLVVPGFALEPRPFQRAGIRYAADARRCIIGDDMGLGKTVEGLGVLQVAGAWPAAVIVPAVVKVNWARETAKFLPGLRVVTLEGMLKPDPARRLVRLLESTDPDAVLFGHSIPPGGRETVRCDRMSDVYQAAHLIRQADLLIVNYDVIGPTVPTPKEATAGRSPEAGWTPVLKAVGLAGLISDESHIIKTPTALRSRAAVEIAGSLPADAVVLAMTGTPVLNRRAEVANQLAFIGRLDEFGGAKHVAKMPDLARRLRARCMIRREKGDVLTELPARQHTPVIVPTGSLDSKTMAEYRHAETDLLDFLAKRAAEIAADAGEDPRSAAVRARMRAAGNEFLVRIGVLLRLAVKAKRNAARDWIHEFEQTGQKLLVFGVHLEQLDEFATEFAAPTIKGGVDPEQRMRIVDDFQDPHGARLCFLQIHAGGVGLTMTAASNVLFLEQAWSPMLHDQAIDRCHGRMNDPHGSVGWYLIAEGTIEEWVSELLAEKRLECADALDGDVTAGQVDSSSVYGDLVERLVARATQ
jgi:hypothetical protein